MEDQKTGPRYYGMRKYVFERDGYELWLASDWHPHKMADGRKGTIYIPNEADPDTCFLAEKVLLDYGVRPKDVPLLRGGFKAGLASLPGCEIEFEDETITPTLMVFEARFTFLEGEARRKRWVRNVYWGEGQLILIAQGSSPEMFAYWLPMFTNIMLTAKIT